METRTLMTFERLPKRDRTLDRAQVDTDIRDACAKAERRLNEIAARYHNAGWTAAEDGWNFDVTPNHTIVGQLKLERP